MTGLRTWTRDPELPAQAGDSQLTLPTVDAVADLIARNLLRPETPALAEVTWIYARWKPRTSGERRLV